MLQAFKTQFIACLLVFLAGWPHFRLVVGLVGLIVDLAIGGVEFICKKVAAGFSGYFL